MLKDLYVFKNFKGNIIFSFFMFLFLITMASMQMDCFLAGSILFLIFFGMNSISTFSYDENADSDKYLLSLPITRKEIGILVSFIITLIVRGRVENIGDSLRICFLAFTSVSFLMCSNIPCIYKWGVEKGRMQSVIIPALFIFIIGILGGLLLLLFPGIYQELDLVRLFKVSPIICLILNILFYGISYMISYKIFSKKSI